SRVLGGARTSVGDLGLGAFVVDRDDGRGRAVEFADRCQQPAVDESSSSKTTSTGAEATARFGRWIQTRLGEESRVTMRSTTSSDPMPGPSNELRSWSPTSRDGTSGGAQCGGGASGAAT